MSSYTISSERDTERFAGSLQRALVGGRSFGLRGDLGAGKTALVRYMVTAAGGDYRSVSSPTYTLQHEYRLPSGVTIEHWDLYRVRTVPEELEEETPVDRIRLIEWPERCPEILARLDATLRLSLIDGDEGGERRVVDVEGPLADELRMLLDEVKGAV